MASFGPWRRSRSISILNMGIAIPVVEISLVPSVFAQMLRPDKVPGTKIYHLWMDTDWKK